ncbi:MAG: type II toxin-antitoxin system RelE/ParE family toxin [Phycisphaerae bacterium]|nr:type II toxin-antitoxin system RelE/ParE family toxin [Phycisphaerae bacterium]
MRITTTAYKDLASIPKQTAGRILDRIQKLENGLTGDIKKLNDFDPPYRLRVGEYRVLFDMEASLILVRSIKHRKDAYR